MQVVMRYWTALFAVAVPLLGGCASPPVAEIKAFRESVVTTDAAATPMLDELSATERRIKGAGVAQLRNGVVPDFVPADAGYFSSIGDAPATALYRKGHNVLDRLSDVLLQLATGATAAADADSVASFASQAADLVGLIPIAAPFVGEAKGVFSALTPILTEISKEASRQNAKHLIDNVQAHQIVRQLTGALTAATPAMFHVLVRDADRKANSTRATADDQAAYVDRAQKVRLMLSNYVVMLQQTSAAWDEAVKAADSQSDLSVAVLTDRISELRATVTETRKAFAEMNAPPKP